MADQAKRNFTLESLDGLSIDELAAFDAGVLFDLQATLDEAAAKLKARNALFQSAMSKKYPTRPSNEAGTGTIHIDGGDNLDIVCEVKKKVEWDQLFLAGRWEQIRAAGDDPAIYIKATYSVPEPTWNGWSPTYKNAFVAARKVTPQKPTFEIKDKSAKR